MLKKKNLFEGIVIVNVHKNSKHEFLLTFWKLKLIFTLHDQCNDKYEAQLQLS